MYQSKRISLVIPAYNEEKLICPTLESILGIIDKVYVLDDGSTENMANVIREYIQTDSRVELIQHGRNRGVGQEVITGYKKSGSENYDITVVAGGDN
jgi:glycosyltransferase involved in cell wall biosynthesis